MYVLVINDLNEDMEYSIPIFFIVTLATFTIVLRAHSLSSVRYIPVSETAVSIFPYLKTIAP